MQSLVIIFQYLIQWLANSLEVTSSKLRAMLQPALQPARVRKNQNQSEQIARQQNPYISPTETMPSVLCESPPIVQTQRRGSPHLGTPHLLDRSPRQAKYHRDW